jgi:hypothetical protein
VVVPIAIGIKTNIANIDDTEEIRKLLLEYFPCCQINWDLEDFDKILRIKGKIFIEIIWRLNPYNTES